MSFVPANRDVVICAPVTRKFSHMNMTYSHTLSFENMKGKATTTPGHLIKAVLKAIRSVVSVMRGFMATMNFMRIVGISTKDVISVIDGAVGVNSSTTSIMMPWRTISTGITFYV